MTIRTVSIVAALGAATSLASAQAQSDPPVTVTYHLSWTEVSATAPYAPVANPNGTLEPGEGARFAFNASLDPDPGTPLTYPTSLLAGSGGAGILAGFWSGNLDLTGDAGAGTWIINYNSIPSANPNRLGVLPPFAAGYPASSGAPNADGSAIHDISPAQFGSSSFNSASPTPTMWRGVWIPSSYSQRSAAFVLSPGSLGQPMYVFAWDTRVFIVWIGASTRYSSVLLPIIPSPPTLALLGAASAFAIRRVRRRCRVSERQHFEAGASA